MRRLLSTSLITICAAGLLAPAAGSTGRSPTMPWTASTHVLRFRDAHGRFVTKRLLGPELLQPDAAVGGRVSPGGACATRGTPPDVRVTGDCGFSEQEEPTIAVNPRDPRNLVAASNDFRTGYNKTILAFSRSGGQRWDEAQEPFQQKLNAPELQLPSADDPNRNTVFGDPGSHRSYEHCSDPTLAFDSAGRAFYSCVAFDVAFQATMIAVALSPAGAHGAYFQPLDAFSRTGVVVEDNTTRIFHDKPLLAADRFRSSPHRDNVYAVWAAFRSRGSAFSSLIYGSMSTDHGQTWSTPRIISGGGTVCGHARDTDPAAAPTACNLDHAPAPEVMPDGNLAVVFFNQNTDGSDNQYLAVTCRPHGSTPAGTARLGCAHPIRVARAGQPGEPTCALQAPIECVPGLSVYLEDDPHIAVQPANGHLYVAFQDYHLGRYAIELTHSYDHGRTWSRPSPVAAKPGYDSFMPAVAATPAPAGRDLVAVGYYRAERITAENSAPPGGFVDGQGGAGSKRCRYMLTTVDARAQTVPLSPGFRSPQGAHGHFIGDYTWVAFARHRLLHAVWADTRNRDPQTSLRDLDIFTSAVRLRG